MHELVRKTVKRILVNDDQGQLAFDTDAGMIVYTAYGDCCSETWFADITGIDALLNATVTGVEEINMESIDDGRTRQEHDEFYGLKIITTKGRADIVYRNSSNGYYGGEILLKDEPTDITGWSEIKDDWQA
jgi:hypothetical protein